MAVALLDTNVLLALAWPNHLHHEAAHEWLARRRGQKWATCLLTELAFVRLSSQPAVVKTTIATADAWQLLDVNLAAENHEFWPLEGGMSDLLPELRRRVMGHHQLADAVLLDLAIRRSGRLATFDRRLENLLPPGSDHRQAIEILTVE